MEDNQNYLEQKAKFSRIIRKVSIITLVGNIMLTALKAAFGSIFFNVSVISDAVHSLSDVGTTVLVLLAVWISKPQADKKHNYGHEKIEPLIVLFFALILAGTGAMLIIQGVQGVIAPKAVSSINYYLLGVTVLSIVSKEVMYQYTIHYARITRSDALKADAWHHRSDSLSSIAVLIGLICSVFIKTDLIESIAILLVSALIIKVAIQILISSINQLIDKAADEKTCGELEKIIKEVEGVNSVDKLQTRLFGNAIFADVEIGVDNSMTVTESHNIAEAVHHKLESQDKISIKHCHVHVNPAGEKAPDDAPQGQTEGLPEDS